jgi:hypothetical protein
VVDGLGAVDALPSTTAAASTTAPTMVEAAVAGRLGEGATFLFAPSALREEA